MAEEYRFLRFESVGITTIIFLILGIIPFIPASFYETFKLDLSSTAAIVGAIFLLSLPLGYISHQFVVNKYRSENKQRKIHIMLENRIKKINPDFFKCFTVKERMSFLTSILDIFIYNKENRTNKEIHDRISGLWSHFYARKAVGKYSPIIGIIIQAIILILFFFSGVGLSYSASSFKISIIIWSIILVVGKLLIDPYSKKIWIELNYLEALIILYEGRKIQEVLETILEQSSLNGDDLKMEV